MPVTLEELRAQYLDHTMGPKIIERVRLLVSQQLRRRDPRDLRGQVRTTIGMASKTYYKAS